MRPTIQKVIVNMRALIGNNRRPDNLTKLVLVLVSVISSSSNLSTGWTLTSLICLSGPESGRLDTSLVV